MVLGSCLVVLDDAIEVGLGIFETNLSGFISGNSRNSLAPWYVGVF
jgi:hypothetical protein